MLIQEITVEKFETETQEGELTAIHFIATPSHIYEAGWWVCVHPEIFIRPSGTSDVLRLVFAFNIPIAPAKHYFKTRKEKLHFTLFFPALPKGTTHIDIIEKVGGSINEYFNFYRVSMGKIRTGVLKH